MCVTSWPHPHEPGPNWGSSRGPGSTQEWPSSPTRRCGLLPGPLAPNLVCAGRRLSRQRQPDDEPAAIADICYRDLACVRFDDAPRDTEPEASALVRGRRTGALAAECHVEDPGKMLGGYPSAGVTHADRRHAGVLRADDLDRAIRW